MLTGRQQEVYDFIVRYIAEHDRSPAHKAIIAGTGVNNTPRVSQILKILERDGYIRRGISVPGIPCGRQKKSAPLIDS